MFNNFFYEPTGLDTCRHFISAQPDSLAIVVDPPFGGLVQVLAHSIRKLWNVAGKGKGIGYCMYMLLWRLCWFVHRASDFPGVSILHGVAYASSTAIAENDGLPGSYGSLLNAPLPLTSPSSFPSHCSGDVRKPQALLLRTQEALTCPCLHQPPSPRPATPCQRGLLAVCHL